MIDVDLNAVAAPLKWSEIFKREASTEVELGSGKGRFLLEMAAGQPERNFVAVERAAKYHKLCCERAARRGLTNVRLIRTTAEDLLFRLLGPACVDAIYVLFPDPWPKKRHHKRRFFKADTVAAVTRTLAPSGRLLVKTDHEGYAEIIGLMLEREPGLESCDPCVAFEGLPLTGFEHKYLAQGRDIFSFAARRI